MKSFFAIIFIVLLLPSTIFALEMEVVEGTLISFNHRQDMWYGLTIKKEDGQEVKLHLYELTTSQELYDSEMEEHFLDKEVTAIYTIGQDGYPYLLEIGRSDDEFPTVFGYEGEPLEIQQDNDPVVTAPVLARDYANNELAADNKYRGKNRIIIIGIVDSIQRTFGEIQLRFEGQNMFNHVYINLDKSQADMAAQLQKGQEDAVECADVENIGGIVHAKGCVFVR